MTFSEGIGKMEKTGFSFFPLLALFSVLALSGACTPGLSGKDLKGALSLPSDSDLSSSAIKLPREPNPADARLRPRDDEGVPAAFPGFSYQNATLTEDTEWYGNVTLEGALTVAQQATLTIAPGTLVRFYPPADEQSAAIMLVQGRLVANGTSDKPVVFRSTFRVAEAGDWQGIVFLASEKKNLLEHCRVEGALTGISGLYSTVVLKNSLFSSCQTGMRFQDSSVRISGGGAGKCDLGLNLYDSEADVMGADFSRNRIGIAVQKSSLTLSGSVVSENTGEAIRAVDSRVTVSESSIRQNGSGITLSFSEGVVSRNKLDKNMNYGISLTGSRIKVSNNDITDNGVIGIRVADGKGIAWGNAIAANGQYDLYNAGSENFIAIGNWWGDLKPQNLAGRIYGLSSSSGGRVHYLPILEYKPVVTP